ncbi:MAG: hypothetical protein EOO66_14705 [Methylobacterium sp.]|nr:MAG: hypothetical protein EOO66_14705 [Methylobacterium sp.]
MAHVLIILALFWAAPKPPPPREVDPDPKTFSLYPAPNDVTRPTPQKSVARSTSAARKAPAAAPVGPAVVPPPPPIPAPAPLKMLPGGMELFDAADIGKMGDKGDTGTETAGTGKGSGKVYGPGDGPGGEQLYDVDWYRRPTQAELDGYLPNGAPAGSYAIIACRMIEDYHVENCRQVAESPVGSGLARAMRLAAWQFRVLPPREGNRKILGGWVRIKISFGELPMK